MTNLDASPMRRRLLAVAVAHALAIAPFAALAGGAEPNAPQDAANPPAGSEAAKQGQSSVTVTLKEVTVTAQRRSQNLQAVPISVTAIDAADLESRGIVNVKNLSGAAPGIVVMGGTGGDPSTAQIAIRGTFAGNPAMYWDSPVGIYLDGVYIGKATGSVFDLPDLERVEVLRGPQGTLYGRNTMGGAVNLVTSKPTGEFGGTASVGYGSYNDKVARLVLDLPAWGKLKASVGGRYEKSEGWVKAPAGSPISSFGAKDDRQAFVALHLDATDDLSFDYRFDYTKNNDTPFFNQAIHSDVQSIFHIPGIVVNTTRQTRGAVNSPEYENMRINGNMLTGNWNLGDAGTIKYIGSYRQMHRDYGIDFDGSPIKFAQTEQSARYQQFSHELQYLGSVGNWNWVTGLYYFDDKGKASDPQQFFLGRALYDGYYGFGTLSRAAYGQVDYKFTDKWTLTAGLRRTMEDKKISRYQTTNGFVNIPAGTAARSGFSATTPMLNLAYQATPKSMLYLRYAKGFMSGGFNGQAATAAEVTRPFLPQTAQTYELGSKNVFWDGRASLNADVFYSRTTNLQSIVFTAQGSTASNVRNVGESHSRGAEVQGNVRLTPDLSVNLNYAYLEGKFDKYMQLGQDIAGNQAVSMVPKHMGSLVIDDTLWRTSNGVLRATVDYRVISGYYRYSYQIKQLNPGQAVAANSWIKGYGTVNAQLSFGGMNWGNGLDGEVSLWVHNVTDVAHIDNIIDFGPSFGNLRIANWNAPRTFGLNVTARW